MSARVVARNSGRVLGFVLTALLLFGALFLGFGFGAMLITYAFSASVSTQIVVIAALIAFVAITTQTHRYYPAPRMIPDATVELRGWLWCTLTIDVILGLVNYCPGILPS